MEKNKKSSGVIPDETINFNKEVLTSYEASKYMGVSKSYLYKLTSTRKIPHYKSPLGKMCYFNRRELERWLQSVSVATDDELTEKARKYEK